MDNSVSQEFIRINQDVTIYVIWPGIQEEQSRGRTVYSLSSMILSYGVDSKVLKGSGFGVGHYITLLLAAAETMIYSIPMTCLDDLTPYGLKRS